MPGLFDGMRIATSGIRTHRVLEEVIGQNIANASNENYTRQQVQLDTLGTVFDGKHFLGQGVNATEVMRVRDELLDTQLRGSKAGASYYDTKVTWLEKIQSALNEPSDTGINSQLSAFWESWSELSSDPQGLATRSAVISRTQNLTRMLNTTDEQLVRYSDDLDQSLRQEIGSINALTSEIAQLNDEIFEIEAGRTVQANDLRDRRDAALDKLSDLAPIQYYEDANGMMTVAIGLHPAVSGDKSENLVAKNDPLDASKLRVMWEHGDRFRGVDGGSLGALLNLRDSVIPQTRGELDAIANLLLTEVNKLYGNGVGLSPVTSTESALGYEALGVKASSDALAYVPTGEYGQMHVTFYDSNDKAVRSNGVVIDPTDSLDDIASKLNGIAGLDASVISDPNGIDGRLRVTLDSLSGQNVNNEVAFTLTNNTGGFDTSGVLDMLGFDQTDKSTNASGVQPVITSRDLTELQTILGEPNVTDVRNHALNLSGRFTINGFETGTESAGNTDGIHVQQLAINVDSTDTINTIMAKVNALTAQHGIAMTFNGGTNQLELTSTARTDANHEIQLAGGTDYLRLSFANDYRYPQVSTDPEPTGYTGKGDNTDIFAALQLNTLFSGTGAGDIALDHRITTANDIHAGYALAAGDNTLANDIHNVQHARIAGGNQFTIGEQYANFIAGVGTSVAETSILSQNEAVQLQSYIGERDSISGVNLDEELAKMIQFQRAYEANARMFSTFSQLAEEILRVVG